jgi:hypothetical protein
VQQLLPFLVAQGREHVTQHEPDCCNDDERESVCGVCVCVRVCVCVSRTSTRNRRVTISHGHGHHHYHHYHQIGAGCTTPESSLRVVDTKCRPQRKRWTLTGSERARERARE